MTVIQMKARHPKAVLKKILEEETFDKFAIVYITSDGQAIYEQRNMSQSELAWASLIVGKHATEVEVFEERE